MKFHWRHSETSAREKLSRHLGTLEDLDKTPTAMFALLNGTEVGLSMRDIGDLVDNHNHLLDGTHLTEAERNVLAHERMLAHIGAQALSRDFGELLDDRLRPREHKPEPDVSAIDADGQRAYAALMQRMTLARKTGHRNE